MSKARLAPAVELADRSHSNRFVRPAPAAERRWLLTAVPSGFAVALCLAIAARAGEPPRDFAAAARTVAPWIDEQTVAVVRVDLSRVDLAAAAKTAIALAPDAKEEIERALGPAGAWLDAFRKAGGREVYVVASMADVGLDREPIPLLAVPLSDKADAKALAGMLPPPLETREAPGRVLLAGTRAALNRLETLKPDERPELPAAVQAAGDAAIQAWLLPPKYTARVIEEMMPRLPEPVGGGPSSVLTQGVRWAAVAIDLPPAPSLRLVVQSQDARSAAALEAVARKALDLLVQDDEVRRLLPQPERLLPLAAPKAQGDRLVLSLDAHTPAAGAVPALAADVLRVLRDDARRDQSMNNLRQIGMAMHQYHAARQRFPAPASYDVKGRPLLSWRVHLLPYLGRDDLYKKFHLDEPWDSDHNRKLTAEMPAVYRSPAASAAQPGHAVYVLPVGPGTTFPGKEGLSIDAFKDGTSATILAVEVARDQAVPWTRPQDLEFDPKEPARQLGPPGAKECLALFADGSVAVVDLARPAEQLRALFTPAGGDKPQ